MSKSNKTLSLIDLRGFIHTGVVKSNVLVSSPSYNGNVAKVNSLSAGGTAYLLSFILKNLSKTDIIVATDSAYSVRRDRYSGYKATRRKKYSLNREKREALLNDTNLAVEILRKSNIEVTLIKGYEADDVIGSYTKKFKNVYEQIDIYSGDSDLEVLLEHNVTKRKINSRTSDKSAPPDKINRYISLYKAFNGDTADDIPSLSLNSRKMMEFLSVNNVRIEEYVKNIADLCYLNAEALKTNIFLTYLKDNLEVNESTEPDLDMLRRFSAELSGSYNKSIIDPRLKEELISNVLNAKLI